MTGFQEQKCKCVVWELATTDYDYRYKILKNGLGECSCLDEKQQVLKAMCDQLGGDDVFANQSDRKALIRGMRSAILAFFDACSHLGWFDRDKGVFDVLFKDGWERAVSQKTGRFFAPEIMLSPEAEKVLGLKVVNFGSFYKDVVFRHRNRCAHNTTSYHGERLTFEALSAKGNAYENYLVRFGVLILIDDIMRKTFDAWQKRVTMM